MATVNNNSVYLNELMAKVDNYHYNPSSIARVHLDALSEITDGKVNIVDASNPFIFLLEATSVNTASFMHENYLNHRRLYPSLATTEEDLYNHMSDHDYIGRFSTPATGLFKVALLLRDLDSAPVDENINARSMIIPKDTNITIDGTAYSFTHAVKIIKYFTGFVSVVYQADVSNPLKTLTNSIINYVTTIDINRNQWLEFEIPLIQVKVNSLEFTIQSSSLTSETISFSELEQYYYARVWFKNNGTSLQWKEISTTHSESVYDAEVPTAKLRVLNNTLNVTIPSIYVNSNKISGSLRVDLYTTKGDIYQDMSKYSKDAFISDIKDLDDVNNINEYTVAFSSSVYAIFSDKVCQGGTNGLSLPELRSRVINNSLGDANIPISEDQLSSYVENLGFTLVKNIDLITNRTYLAVRGFPKPNTKRVNIPCDIGVASINVSRGFLSSQFNVTTNGLQNTIKSNTIFKMENGQLSFLSLQEKQDMDLLTPVEYVRNINDNYYLYNPFYYVYDKIDLNEYELRSYDLDSPEVTSLSFQSQNETMQLGVNTGTIDIEKVDTGYKLTVKALSGDNFKSLADSEVYLQLAYYPTNEGRLAYINATQVGVDPDSGERIYEIPLDTNIEIDAGHNLFLTNGNLSGTVLNTPVPLSQKYYLIWSSNSVSNYYRYSAIDDLIGYDILPVMDIKGVTLEEIGLSLGIYLKHIWSKSRPVYTTQMYRKHTTDIPATYTATTYDTNPATNSTIDSIDPVSGAITWYNRHDIGDPVLDGNGDPVYSAVAGDVMLDGNGEPIIDSVLTMESSIELLLLDGRYLLSRNSVYDDYRKEMSSTLKTWSNENLPMVSDKLLENTEIFYYPSTNFSNIRVLANNDNNISIGNFLKFTIDLYVTKAVDSNQGLKISIRNNILDTIIPYLDRTVLATDELIELIKTDLGNTVNSISMRGFNNNPDTYYIEILDTNNRFSIDKNLTIETNNDMVITEALKINWKVR